jgi:ferric-dicitrate binding protein FerR (iron transport regulator)
MSDHSEKKNSSAEIDHYIELACEDLLTPADAARLETLLVDQPANQQHFIDCMIAQSLLERSDADQPSAVSDQLASAHHSSLSPHHSSITPRRRDWLSRNIPRKSYGVALATTVAVVALMAAWPISNYLADRNLDVSEDAPIAAVARLVRVADAKWQAPSGDNAAANATTTIAPPKNLYPGQKLQLASGLAEFQFSDGAVVVLEGPAELEFQSRKACALAAGKLVTRVEKQRAKGFVVETPAARITDLGTEFGVHVDEDQKNSVTVFAGKIEVASHARGAAPLELTSGQTLVLDAKGTVEKQAAQEPLQFVRHVAAPVRDFQPGAKYVEAVKHSHPSAYWRFEHADEGGIASEMNGDLPLRMVGDARVLKITADNSVAVFQQVRKADALACDDVSKLVAGDYTFEAWAMPASASSAAATIAHIHSSSQGSGMLCALRGIKSGNETLFSARYLHRWPLGSTGGRDMYSKTRFAANSWNHIAAVRQQGTATLWLNGKPEASAENAAPLDAASLQLVLGRLYEDAKRGDARPFTGYIDEVAIYDRALSPTEIEKHYTIATETASHAKK